MKFEKVRVAVIGAGSLANAVHYPSLAEMPDVELVALCDLVEAKRAQTAARFGVPRTYGNYLEMLEAEAPDAVYVIMPPHHLYDIAVQCLQRGRHLFIEKPPGVTAFQTASLARLAAQHGCLTMVGFNRRFIPMLRQVRERLAARGPIHQVVATFYKKSSAVYYHGAIDVLTCDAIHAVDALRWLAGGEATAVSSLISQHGDVVPNSWNALVRFDTGAAGLLLTHWNVGGRVHTFEIHGPGISAFLNPDASGLLIEDGKTTPLDPFALAGSREQYRSYGFYQESRHFIDCIKEGRQPETHFADAVKTMELVERIYQTRVG